jgi:hypothetical protein
MAQVTLDISAAHVVRIQDALTETLGLTDMDGQPRQATVQEFKDHVIADIKQLVAASERRVIIMQARQNAPDEVDIT